MNAEGNGDAGAEDVVVEAGDEPLPADLPALEMSPEEKELMETEVMELLPECEVEELEHLIDLLNVDCPGAAKGNRNSLMKVLFTHVLQKGGEEDAGLGTYKAMHKYLTEKKKDDEKSQDLRSVRSRKSKSSSGSSKSNASVKSKNSDADSLKRVREWQKKKTRFVEGQVGKELAEECGEKEV